LEFLKWQKENWYLVDGPHVQHRVGVREGLSGLQNCYAETLALRFGFDVWGKGKPRRTFGQKHWNRPLKWNRSAAKEGVQKKVFCSSDVWRVRGSPDSRSQS
jgi:hypothetical protein